MKLKAFDVHTHRLTGERRESDVRLRDGAKMFGGGDDTTSQLEYFQQRGLMAAVFDVDAESTTGLRIDNDEILEFVAKSDGQFIGFASVDPWKGAAAIREIERRHSEGMKGVKFQPITQAFHPNDRRFYPIWERCEELGLPVLVHMGTTAMGNGSPGGRGLHLKYAKPIPGIDDIAADFPDMTIIAAHPGWPWHTELLAVARHKGNVFVDLSGWAPKYFPSEVFQYFNSVMPEKFLYGSDYPLFKPDRWFKEFDQLDVKPASRRKILFENACEIFSLPVEMFEG